MSDLRSKSFARIVDLISEGEIVGLVNGAKSIYLNGTPLENADGSRNFENVSYETRPGTQAQTYIPDAAAIESSLNVATEVTASTSVVRTVSNSDVNAVRVILSVPALYRAKDDGSQVGTSVQIAIDVQASGGSYVTKVTDTIDGKATSKYQRAYKIALTGSAPWNIRVRRITADSTNLKIQNKTFWDTYTEIIEAKLRYPNSAIVTIRFDAAAFQGVPTRGYDVKLIKVKVPVNYNPTTRVYTGVWDGTFKTEWTDNPAWCFYDLVTNERYGLGTYIPTAQVDKWALYTISQYCDQLVNDGFGGLEPRFTCNLYLQSRAEAFKVVQDLASCFRSMVYWASGALTVAQDAPSDPVALYTQANVIEGRFTYSGASAKARHTVALVTWNDPADLYKQKIEYVEDAEAIARFGVVPTEVVAVGCTSRGQANRVGRWLLYSERYESETVSFRTGIEGAVVRPGQIIKVADSARAGTRLGGRVVSATTTVVGVDAPLVLGAGTWTMFVMLPNGTVESRTVSSSVGQSVTLASALSAAPQAGAQWLISGTSVEAQTFRVVTISEVEGEIEITGVRHDPDKYAAVENGLVLQSRSITSLDDPPEPVTVASLSEYLYTTPTDVKVGASISWSPVAYAATYLVQYRIEGQNVVEQVATAPSLELLDCEIGTYSITIYAVNALSKRSLPYTFSATVLGKTAKPADITGFQLVAQGATGLLQWNLHPDLDVRIGGQIVIRFSELSAGASWNTAIPVAEFSGGSNSGTVPLAAGTYLARAMDSSGQLSANAAEVVSQTLSIIQYNAVIANSQHPSFSGTKTDMFVESNKLKLEYIPTPSLDLDFTTGTYQEGEVFPDPTVQSGMYEFASYIDIGAVYTSRVSVNFAADTINLANVVDRWPAIDTLGDIDLGDVTADYVDTWLDWDAITNFDAEIILGDASATFEVATTNDNPAGTPTWSEWRQFYLGDYTARAFKFRMIVDRGADTYTQVEFSELGVTIDVPDRIESAKNVSVGVGGLTVTYTNAFYDTPAVAITPYNLATGDYLVVSGQSSTGFTVAFKNSAGTNVARTMDWIAKGFGYKTT
jgi:predicted phage tail protein